MYYFRLQCGTLLQSFNRWNIWNQKPEKLIQSIIEFTTVEGDIVFDFFVGSGTFDAVADKMKRQYIGI
ncbi:DNA methyltransferase [Mycoplasmopsis cynos]|uniref:DNA methyltransferase n=1 Tax=Mycoplasmopsis cynos TaxID=171284 RepID=UPI003A5C84E3